ncbi:MAG: DUF4097 family beta strand repeat-containing protein, partial [Candidatus Baltobacteraceae bacterium]
MRSSRTALVAMLLAAELLIVGLMLFALRGWNGGHVFAASGLREMNASAKTYAPVAAGLTPHVQIDDPDSGVRVSASNDGLVHVKDLTSIHGFVWGSSKVADLTVSRTADGVHISRPSQAHGIVIFGGDLERIEVAVPSGSHVDIARSSSAEVSDMQSAVDVKSQDGHIGLFNIRGSVNAHSDDGHIEATNVSGDTLAMSTDDGSLRLKNITAGVLEAKTSDGRIDASNLSIDGQAPRATLHTDDGSVHITGRFSARGSYDFSTRDGREEMTLAPGSDMTINASTDSGRIYVDGASFGGDDSAAHTIRLGNGSGAMRLSTQDG